MTLLRGFLYPRARAGTGLSIGGCRYFNNLWLKEWWPVRGFPLSSLDGTFYHHTSNKHVLQDLAVGGNRPRERDQMSFMHLSELQAAWELCVGRAAWRGTPSQRLRALHPPPNVTFVPPGAEPCRACWDGGREAKISISTPTLFPRFFSAGRAGDVVVRVMCDDQRWYI